MVGMLELDGLIRRFGNVTALDSLSFSVRAGQVVGFLGPSSAGKTTTMRAIFGLIDLDVGSVGGTAPDGHFPGAVQVCSSGVKRCWRVFRRCRILCGEALGDGEAFRARERSNVILAPVQIRS